MCPPQSEMQMLSFAARRVHFHLLQLFFAKINHLFEKLDVLKPKEIMHKTYIFRGPCKWVEHNGPIAPKLQKLSPTAVFQVVAHTFNTCTATVVHCIICMTPSGCVI